MFLKACVKAAVFFCEGVEDPERGREPALRAAAGRLLCSRGGQTAGIRCLTAAFCGREASFA